MRALGALPLPDGVDCAALAEKNFHFIYTSFGTRTSLKDEEWKQYGLKGCIALRMLHWHFASSMDYHRSFLPLMNKYAWKSVDDAIDLALCTIAADLGGTVDAPAVLMVALDEYTVADTMSCVLCDITNTQGIYTAFASLMTTGSKPYVFCPVFVGLVQQPLVDAERCSKVKFVPLPLHCLTMEECELLADAVLSAETPHWRSNAMLRRFLFQARAVPKLLMGVLNKFKDGERDANTFQKIVSSMSDPQQVTPSTLRSFLRLFACVVLKQTDLFHRLYYLPKEHDTLTLSEWEDRGGVFRSTVLDWQVPPSIFASVLTLTEQEGCSEAERNLLYCIHYLCHRLDADAWNETIQPGQLLEQLGGLYHCMRINSLLLMHNARDPGNPCKVPLSDILPGATLSPSAAKLHVTLRPMSLVELCAEQYVDQKGDITTQVLGKSYPNSSASKFDITISDAVFVAAPGQEAVDVFMCFPKCYVDGRPDAFPVFLFDQRKLSHTGINAAVFDEGFTFCRQFVSKLPGPGVGWVYGIVNPIQRASVSLKDAIMKGDKSVTPVSTAPVATGTAVFEGAFLLDFDSCPDYHRFTE